MKSDSVNRSVFTEENPAKFHLDPSWNDGALGVLNSKNNDKMSSQWDQFLIQKSKVVVVVVIVTTDDY